MRIPTSTEWNDFSALRERLEALNGAERHAALDILSEENPQSPVLSLLTLHFALPEERADAFSSGDRIDNLTLGEQLGAGAMGVVYEAHQPLGDATRLVALKLISPALWQRAPAEARKRFADEVQALALLQYDGIARLYTAGNYRDPKGGESAPYLVMELVRGGRAITDFARERDLSVQERLRLFHRVCRAIQHAHDHRIIHRDLKPANILVDSGGRPFVVDFGLAQSSDALPPGGAMVASGTPAYMGPEQISNDFGPVSEKTDTYALGVVLYELLTGKRPYVVSLNQSLERLQQVITQVTPSAIGEHNPDLAGELEAIVKTALVKQPEQRATAGALAARIERYLHSSGQVMSVPAGLEAAQTRSHDADAPSLGANGLTESIPVLSSGATTTIPAMHGGASRQQGPTGRRFHPAMYGAAIALLVAFLFAALLATHSRQAPASATPAIAVLPFSDISPANDYQYLAEGLAGELVTSLARQSGIAVISRTSSFAFKDQQLGLKAIGSQLGAIFIVEGSVRVSQSNVQIKTWLSDARSGRQLFKETFDRSLNQLSDIHLDIANRVSQALASELGLEAQALQQTREASSLAAYDAYLKGRQQLSLRTVDAMWKAQQSFEKALALQPDFLSAMTGLIETQYRLEFHGQKTPEEIYRDMLPVAQRALELAPDRSDVHLAMGRLLLGTNRSEEAEQALRTAVRLNGNDAEALGMLAFLLTNAGRPQEAVSFGSRALRLEPADPMLAITVGMSAEFLGDFECSERLYRRALDIAPALMNAHFALGSYLWRIPGDRTGALAHLTRSVELDPDGPIQMAVLALLHLDMGDPATAQVWLERAEGNLTGVDYWTSLARLGYAAFNDDAPAAETAATRRLRIFAAGPYSQRVKRDQALRKNEIESALSVYPAFSGTLGSVNRNNVRIAADAAYTLSRTGQDAEAKSLARQVLFVTETLPRRGWGGFHLADVTALLILEGPDSALERLRLAQREGWHALWWWELRANAALSKLREMPGYTDVEAKIAAGPGGGPVRNEVDLSQEIRSCAALDRAN